MNGPLPRLLLLIVACAASSIPQRLRAQGEEVHARNDCRLASQILRTRHPAPHLAWAWSVIPSCADSAGPVLAEVWHSPPEGEQLAQLWGVSHRVRDARLTEAVLLVLRDRAYSRAVRITAARVLATHAAPDLVVLERDLETLRGDSLHVAHISVDHSDLRSGSVPVTPELVTRIRRELEAVGMTDPDPEVRSAADAIARQIDMHRR